MARTSTPLLDTTYGRLLGIKIALVTLAAMLGALNRMVRLPRLRSARTFAANASAGRFDHAYLAIARAFDRTIALEALTLLLVLVAAVLAH
ncbi:CopD family protein, partial [Escherichia coli]|nr:CopD family protein [Escherichia coli]